MLVERKVGFIQNAGNLGRWLTHCPPKATSEDSFQLISIFKKKSNAS